MYGVSAAIFTMPGSPCTILARIGLFLYSRGWGIRQLGISLVIFTSEAGLLRHFPLRLLRARASAHLRVATLTSTGYSLLARRLTTRRTRILTYSLLFFCLKLNTYLQHHHCCSCTFIRRQNGLCGLSTQQSLLILVDHTASSNQAFNSSLLVTKLNLLVSFTFLVFGCVFRVLKAM